VANAPEDIIELTDIIERGPGAPKADASGSGGDLNFERELEDLFADAPGVAGGKGADSMPGFDGLDLPDETGTGKGAADDIDLDGLDALLAEAGKATSGVAAPNIPDDFLDMALGEQAPEKPAKAASPAATEETRLALEALGGRLDTLEAKFSGLGESLAQTFMPMVDEALAGFKAGLPPALDEEALEGRLASRLESGVEARVGALKDELAAERAAAEMMAEPGAEPLDPAALLADVDARLEALKAEISETASAQEAPADPAPMIEELGGRLESEIAALQGRIEALSGVAAEPGPSAELVDHSALLAEVDARLEVFKAEAASLADALGERLDAELDGLRQGLAALESRVSELEAAPAPFPEISEADVAAPDTSGPDLSNLVTQEALDALRQELLAEIRRTVPAAAAQIIREEIRALVQEMGD